MTTRRGKGTLVPDKSTPDKEQPTPRSRATTNTIPKPTTHDDTELLAIKLNRNYDKVARYESHQDYLSACIKDQLIPMNFKIQLEPSIGNHDEAFLSTWYDKIQKFSIELMKDTIKFCDKTITKTKSEIQSQEEQIKKQTDQEEYNEIKTTITKFNEQKIKELQRNKTAKHRRLRWNLNTKQRQDSKEQHSVTRANHGAQPYTERNSSTYAKESLPSREAPILTEPRTYAEILKPRFNNRKNRPIAGNTTYNGNQSDRISRGIANTDAPLQPQGNGYTNYKTSKNLTSPRPTEVEGGIQQLLANTSEAFKLLQNNFEKLVVLKMTQMEK